MRLRRRWRFWAFSCLFVIVVSLVGTVIAAAAATSTKASIKITALPASAPQFTEISVTVSGQAGPYNRVVAADNGTACPAQVQTTYHQKTVKPNHPFKVKLLTNSDNPGTHHACVYLYNTAHPSGRNVHASKTFQTT